MPDCFNGCLKLRSQNACPCVKEESFYGVLTRICFREYDSQMQVKFGKPMLWIGFYIAVASLFCTLAMGADLLHGFRSRKLWFPCKYFTINAASLMVITVAMKLPVDLSNPMLSFMDKTARQGSTVFMCTMMINLMPSLASMSNKELLTNFVALGILVVTIVVNVCIEINTGVDSLDPYLDRPLAIVPVALLLLLLAMMTSSALAIPTSKHILESKYGVGHRMASNEQEPSQSIQVSTTLEKLTQQISRYWVMAGTGNPQFVTITSPTSSASTVIFLPIALFHVLYSGAVIFGAHGVSETGSVYRSSTGIISIIQSIGVAAGTIVALFRCFAALNFKLSIKWSTNHIKVFKVESYWTQKLSDWKQSRLPFPMAGHRCKLLVHHVKNQILSCCIVFQKAVVVICKVIGLLPIFLVIFYVYCFYGYKNLKRMFFGEPIASNSDAVLESEQRNARKDLSRYVLQLNDEVELAERILKGMSKTLNRLIKNAEKQKPNNILKFLERSKGFEGVEQLNNNCVAHLLMEEPSNFWSLTVITLTSIAIAIPNISNNKIDSLLRSVDEGLAYTGLVEESLNTTRDSVKFQKVAKKLWLEVEVYHKWLNNNLQGDAFKGKTSEETLKLLMDRANDILDEVERDEYGPNEISLDRSIAARSMFCITKAILLSYQVIPEPISEEQLFMQLSRMVADVLRACFTNLPEVIVMKCYASVIEKSEESVKGAAELLGQTKEIMNKIQAVETLSMDPDQNGIC